MLVATHGIWALNCGIAIDPETKKPIPVDIWDQFKGVLTGPKPFKCSITPRNHWHAEIVEQEFMGSADTFLPFEVHLSKEDKEQVTCTRDSLPGH